MVTKEDEEQRMFKFERREDREGGAGRGKEEEAFLSIPGLEPWSDHTGYKPSMFTDQDWRTLHLLSNTQERSKSSGLRPR